MPQALARFALASAVIAVLGSVVTAKGPTVKLTITGGGLVRNLEVTDPAALAHVWSDDFLAGPSAPPTNALPRYIVSFHVLLNGHSQPTPMYVVHFAVDHATGDAFVYLPGQGDTEYAANARTIMREGQDGAWYHASEPWARALSPLLP